MDGNMKEGEIGRRVASFSIGGRDTGREGVEGGREGKSDAGSEGGRE